MQLSSELDVRRSRRLGEQINFTFQFIRANSNVLGKCAVRIILPAGLVAGLFWAILFYGSLFGIHLGLSLTPTEGTIIRLCLSGAVCIVLQSVADASVMLYMERGGPHYTVAEVRGAIRPMFTRLVSTAIVTTGIWVAYFGLQALIIQAQSAFLSIIVLLASVITVVYVGVPMNYLHAVRIFEPESSIGDAMTRSFELIKGRWWVNLGLSIALGLIAIYVAIAPTASLRLLQSVLGVFHERGGDETFVVNKIMELCILTLALLTYFLPTVGTSLNYFNLVEKQESTGLLERIAAIDAPDNGATANYPFV